MSRKNLVTIAAFDQPAKARLAQNALTAAEIPAVVSDESLVAMDWLLSNAVGGVKVQVWDEDVDRAVEVLEAEFGTDGAGLGPVEMNERELAAEAEAAEPDDEPESPRTLSTEPDEPTLPVIPDSREDFARRMVFAAMLGLMLPPITFYAIYLLLNAVFGEGELTSRGRFNLWLGGAMTLAALCWMVLFFRIVL